MIGYVMVGTNNLNDAINFYDKVLEVIGLDRNETIEDDYAAYGAKGTKDIEFYVTKPFNKKDATFGNGTQITFLTSSRSNVDKFHEIGLKAGGTSEGSGGERPEGSGVYYSYLRDLDGNKICAFTNNKE
ncbi:MAG: VOC family protein [Candidatus Pelagibacter sp.]|jgi:catechol 2,3-dioxygenase-like lactoylglutathione lyase family enzyme|nr:VOC family protein [Pelagibacterales bacterium SAG-MED16]